MIERLRSLVDVDLPSPTDVLATTLPGRRVDATPGEPDEARLQPADELVIDLLAEREGWLWQQELVEETGYSEGTVSRLLGEMEADGRVSRHWKEGRKIVVLSKLRD